MKNIIAAAFLAAFAGSASAEVVASLEYAVEAQALTAEVGYEYFVNDNFTVSATVTGVGPSDITKMEFVGLDVSAGWTVDEYTTLTLTAAFDENFNYADTILGVTFRF